MPRPVLDCSPAGGFYRTSDGGWDTFDICRSRACFSGGQEVCGKAARKAVSPKLPKPVKEKWRGLKMGMGMESCEEEEIQSVIAGEESLLDVSATSTPWESPFLAAARAAWEFCRGLGGSTWGGVWSEGRMGRRGSLCEAAYASASPAQSLRVRKNAENRRRGWELRAGGYGRYPLVRDNQPALVLMPRISRPALGTTEIATK
ncbi:hypothetical protein EV426DRAFT_702201 [Tirmania nivea]|nr:hypothetical protein EV426DRAFT_702201 [Tirmania nivea]